MHLERKFWGQVAFNSLLLGRFVKMECANTHMAAGGHLWLRSIPFSGESASEASRGMPKSLHVNRSFGASDMDGPGLSSRHVNQSPRVGCRTAV